MDEVTFIQEGPGIRKYEYQEGGYPMINVRCVQNGYIDMTSARAANTDLALGKWAHFQIDVGDILFTISGTIGRCAIVRESDLPILMNTSVVRFKPTDPNLEARFLYYFLQSEDFQGPLKELSSGAAIQNVGPTHIKTLSIPFPPAEEQKRIVATLDQAFAALDRARAHAEANLADADELLEAVKAGFLEYSEATGRRVSLADVTSIDSTLVDPRQPEFLDMPHLGAGNMVSGSDFLVDVMTARQEKLKSGKYLFDGTMVLYSKIRPYLRKVARPDFSGICSADVYPLSPSKELDRNFLFHLLHTKDFTEYAISGSDRAGMPKVNREHLFKYEFGLPLITVQREAADKIDRAMVAVDGLRAVLKSKLTDLANLRQSLLQKAFSGNLT